MPRCNGILQRTGLQCTYSAKENGRCGIHKHNDAGTLLAELNSLRKRLYFIRTLDEHGRMSEIRYRTTLREGKTELLTFIDEYETAIRGDYPGYIGPFVEKFRNVIWTHSYRSDAESRVPNHLKHQINLLHDWMAFMYTSIRTYVPQLRDLTLIQLYTNEYALATIVPRLSESWATLAVQVRTAIRRGITNLRILGQPFAIQLQAVLRDPGAGNDFINDNQNVHRRDTVSYIENVFRQLKKIHVPPTQRTIGEILTHCVDMKPEAQIQMVKMYHAGDSIYEHRRAYPRALDAVWAFVTRHDNKKELYERMSQEMNDNIGMCAQGNLSRICNVLCGYIEGFQPPVAQGILIQNKMAAIASDSEGDKISRAKAALRELMVPEADWAPWIEAFDE